MVEASLMVSLSRMWASNSCGTRNRVLSFGHDRGCVEGGLLKSTGFVR